jgi:UDP-3-O-[3-hydroxymyristoyl] glucosamine N-acyltransferase
VRVTKRDQKSGAGDREKISGSQAYPFKSRLIVENMKKDGKTLKEVAKLLGGTIIGDGTVAIYNIREIEKAEEGDLTFIANPKYKDKLEETRASAVLVSPDVRKSSRNLVVVRDPYVALARALSFFCPEERDFVAVSEGSYICEGAKIAEDVTIYPGVYIGKNTRIEKGVVLYPGVAIGNHVVIDTNSILYPNVTVYRKCVIGKRVVLHAGVVVGSDGFGFANPGRENLKVPQVGIVQIDDDVEVGANTTIDRGTLGKTWIKKGAKIDNLVQIAHNVVIGEKSIVVAQVGISGSSKLGKSVIVGGQAGLVGHIEVGDNVMVAAQSGVHEDVAPNQIISGTPHMSHKKWLRSQACISRLPEMWKTMKSLLKRIDALEEEITGKEQGKL